MRRDLARAFSGLLLLFTAAWAISAEDPKRLNSILIVAREELPDSDFADAIVLVLNNLGPAPAGVIINKPMSVDVSQLFPDLKGLARVHDKVYYGGPVEFGTVWFLFRATKAPPRAIEACEGVYLSADRDLLMQLLGREKPMDGLRIFIGHSGWAPGQLETEIEDGDWTPKRAESDAIFKGKSEHPWPAQPSSKDTI